MRHLVLGLCVLTVSASGAHAQNYLPSRDYSGPTTIVNMDVLQGGGGFGGPSAPILSMPLPPPEPMVAPAPMEVAALPHMDGGPMALVPHNNSKPVIHSSDLGELPPAGSPSVTSEPSPLAPIKTVAVQPAERLTPSSISERDVFITPSLAHTQKAIAASPPAKSIVQEKSYNRSVSTETSAKAISAPMMVPDPVMPHDHGAVQPGLKVASVPSMPPMASDMPVASSDEDFEAYRLFFDGGSSDLKPSEKAVLDKIVKKMNNDPSMRLRMQAYAAGTPETSGQARRLSLARAMKIRSYMTEKGVVATRLDVRALGMGSNELNDTAARSKAPADRVDVIFMRG